MTDNHLSDSRPGNARDAIKTLAAEHILIRSHCPWRNGKVERLNRTSQVKWAYRHTFLSNPVRTAAPAPWLEHYNTQGRHSALGELPPIQPTVMNLSPSTASAFRKERCAVHSGSQIRKEEFSAAKSRRIPAGRGA
jgi:hypothetical protein